MHRLHLSRWARTVVIFAAVALSLGPLLFGGTHAAAPSQFSQVPGSGGGQGPRHVSKHSPHPPGANARPGARPNVGQTWVQLSATNPFTFSGGLAAATDSARGTVVLYLPNCGPQGCATTSQTWVWHTNAWTQAAGTQPSPARDNPSMSFDPSTGKVMLFGGVANGGALLNDTWEFDGANWSQIVSRTAPSPRFNAAMAPAHGGVLLMGGNVVSIERGRDEVPGVFVTGDTWFWNNGTWSQFCPSGILPAPRMGAGMATPPGSVIPILFGGRLGRDPLTGLGNHGLSSQTFVANLGATGPAASPCGWTLQAPTNGPTLESGGGGELLPAIAPRGVVNGQPALGPQPREPGGFAATNTPANGILMFSGESFDDEAGPNTWEYVPGGTPQWQELEVASNPAPNQPFGARLRLMAMATDPSTGTPLLIEANCVEECAPGASGTWRWAH